MHVLLGLLAAALLAYVVYRFTRSAQPAEATPAIRSGQPFAFISNGMLFRRERGADVTQIHSPYVQEAADRRERARERHSWKQGTSFGVAAGGGMRNFEAADRPPQALSAAFVPDGDLFYFLKDESVGGLFRLEAASGRELRVLLRQNLSLTDLSPSADGSVLAASSQQPSGICNIALLQADGSGLREVTGGDTVDSAPAWIPGLPNRLLFQSCGLARSAEGYVVAQGNATIQKLDMDTGSISPILDDPRFDHLKPRVSASGELLFIRRPYEPPRYAGQAFLLDMLLFPFRLLRAVFHYLNFFSLMYSRKPLTSASGPAVQADLKNILLQGRRIDAEKALRSARAVHGVPSLVPESWELVSRDLQGRERVLATNVASFDLGSDGTVIYSNGRGVFVLQQDGTSQLAVTGDLVGEVIARA
jgi:hypothetical protein